MFPRSIRPILPRLPSSCLFPSSYVRTRFPLPATLRATRLGLDLVSYRRKPALGGGLDTLVLGGLGKRLGRYYLGSLLSVGKLGSILRLPYI